MFRSRRSPTAEEYPQREQKLANAIDQILYPDEDHNRNQTVVVDAKLREYASDTKKLLDKTRSTWQKDIEVPEHQAAYQQTKQAFLENIRQGSSSAEDSLHDRILDFIQRAISPKPGAAVPAYRPVEIQPQLIRRRGSEENRATLANQTLIIGRDADAGLRILEAESQQVSRRHAEITPTTDGHAIKDLNSKNGTKLNGSPLKPGTYYRLQGGDRIQCADVAFEFSDGSEKE